MKEGRATRVIVERFQTGEDTLERLNDLVKRNNVTAGSLTAFGAAGRAVVGFFVGNGEYSSVSFEGPMEVLSCVGNVSLEEGPPCSCTHNFR